MAVSAASLVTLEELRTHLSFKPDVTNQDDLLCSIADRASDAVSRFLDRRLVNTATITEYHSMQNPSGHEIRSSELSVRQWPILTVATIHEDTAWPRTYGAGYLLVADTDYLTVKPSGLIRRQGSGGPADWALGRRAIKVVYTAGYAQADVPQAIKSVTLALSALMWAEVDRREFGISSAADAAGNWTRFSAARLTPDMKEQLGPERRHRFMETGEVDA